MADALVQHAHAVVELHNYRELAESLGEETSRLVLAEFEHRVQSVKRPGDGLAKLGDGRYCLVLRDVREREHVTLAAAKIDRQFLAPFELFGEAVRMAVCTGIALPSKAVTDRKQLLRAAHSALRIAIQDGETYRIFTDQDAHHQQDSQLLLRLQEAIDLGEFVPYFQPKVSAAYGTLVGAEALVRWHDAERKTVVGPGEFIETLENSDLIRALTVQILKNSIARCASWPDPLKVSVNITPKLLAEASLVTDIEDTLAFFDLPAERLILEVTERGRLPQGAIKTLHSIGDIGAKIAIDDFGTGESSLLQFRSTPANLIKIDQTFVRQAEGSAKDRAIISGIVELAHQCKMQVIAEGVEDAPTSSLMRELGCDWLQGYWFGKPVPHEEFVAEHQLNLVGSDNQGPARDRSSADESNTKKSELKADNYSDKHADNHAEQLLQLDDRLTEVHTGE